MALIPNYKQSMVSLDSPANRRRRFSVSAECTEESTGEQPNWPVYIKTQAAKAELRSSLKRNLLFQHLDEDQMEIVVNACQIREVEPEEVVIRQGDDGDNFYVVDSCKCDIYVDDTRVAEVSSGDSFGELALMYNSPRAATVKTTTAGKLWMIERAVFRHILMNTTLKKRELYAGFLSVVPILAALTKYERLVVADALNPLSYQDGEYILFQGDVGETFYIVEKGMCVATKTSRNHPDPVIVAKLKQGDYFGELALLTHQPRAANVVAKGDVKILGLDRKAFDRLLGPCEDVLQRNMGRYKSVADFAGIKGKDGETLQSDSMAHIMSKNPTPDRSFASDEMSQEVNQFASEIITRAQRLEIHATELISEAADLRKFAQSFLSSHGCERVNGPAVPVDSTPDSSRDNSPADGRQLAFSNEVSSDRSDQPYLEVTPPSDDVIMCVDDASPVIKRASQSREDESEGDEEDEPVGRRKSNVPVGISLMDDLSKLDEE